jgi:uncharacterized membrane protein YdbT with pleckstrin-like domain
MDSATGVGKNALKYRLVIFEIIGLTISLALTAFVAIIIYFIKIKYAVFIDALLFVSVFLIQFVVIYAVSHMQYKNLKYMIEQNSISFQRGVFGVERETIPFEKIKNSTFDQTFIQRMFGVGDITIDQDDESYVWESVDSQTAMFIQNAVSAKGDVQPITVSQISTLANTLQQQEVTQQQNKPPA